MVKNYIRETLDEFDIPVQGETDLPLSEPCEAINALVSLPNVADNGRSEHCSPTHRARSCSPSGHQNVVGTIRKDRGNAKSDKPGRLASSVRALGRKNKKAFGLSSAQG